MKVELDSISGRIAKNCIQKVIFRLRDLRKQTFPITSLMWQSAMSPLVIIRSMIGSIIEQLFDS